MQEKDFRMRYAEEMLSGIKTIKYNSMENFFQNRLKGKRDVEMSKLRIKKILECIMITISNFLPFIVVAYTY